MATSTDRIQKKVLLRAPQERVWNAVSDAKQFGSWFGVTFEGPFTANTRLVGKMTGTTVDPEIAKRQKVHEALAFEFLIDRIEPKRLFSFRWHPYAVEAGYDYSKEPTTLVTFELEPASGGTMLTITESGFDKIPIERRARAFEMNNGGWDAQSKLIEKYLAQAA